ncbi:substrate-binding domain-containing protein [Actinoplanes oblitus]|uniref:Substrate-binding domain-containing protein n=1 Tax=Actinoplanes oblitus TaxID=3040509 RepID=A0ABY8WKD9_9ACTN|nr:substrate-binding domain-containing protein [Actinoplanes oblitus]WIM98108.1 substrate-binding domain-containing protein [Actinoplanes oblitus]
MPDNEWPDPRLPYPEPAPGRSRAVLAAAVVVLVLLAAGGLAWRLMSNQAGTPVAEPSAAPSSAPRQTARPCPDPKLRVAAAPEIAPVIQRAATTLSQAGQRCSEVAVQAVEPGAVLAAKAQPDVWIPSSSVWLAAARARGRTWTTTGTPLAWSPLVITGPEAIGRLFAPDGRTSWAGLAQGAADGRVPAVRMPDPLLTTTGLLGVHAVRQAIARVTPDDGIATLQALTLRSRLENASADPADILAQLSRATDDTAASYQIGVFPATEQQLTAYQKGGHRVRLVGGPPVDGLVDADYPYATRKGVPAELSKRLRAAITTAALTEAGFRDAATKGALTLPADPEALLGPARQWSGYKSVAFQVLLLVDGSGSMNEKITDRAGHTVTKAALLRQSGATASRLFGEDTSLGMWLFGTSGPTGPAHVEEVSFGPLAGSADGKNRRQQLAAKISSYQPVANAGTPLYQTVLDGVQEMRGRAKPDTATVVVVLTDGSDGGTRFTMSQADFLKRLQAGADPARPVPVIAVGFGPGANLPALQAMAKVTGGRAIAAKNPADLASGIAQAFVAAHGSA